MGQDPTKNTPKKRRDNQEKTAVSAVQETAFSTIDIDGGTIDGTDVTVGSGKTLDVSAGTLTLANDQIIVDKVSG